MNAINMERSGEVEAPAEGDSPVPIADSLAELIKK